MTREFEFRIQEELKGTVTFASPGMHVYNTTTAFRVNSYDEKILELQKQVEELHELIAQAVGIPKGLLSGKA